MGDVADINSRLIRLHGRDTIYNQPNYRVVWSEHMTEKREEEYEDITEAGIYLGTKKGIREKPKYWYISPCWVLEKFHSVFERGVHDEVKESFMYEPLFVFLDKKNKPLPLLYKACEKVIYFFTRAEEFAKNEQKVDLVAEEAKKKEAEVERNRHILHADDPKEKPTFKDSVYVGENK